jgi:hypothetical protein
MKASHTCQRHPEPKVISVKEEAEASDEDFGDPYSDHPACCVEFLPQCMQLDMSAFGHWRHLDMTSSTADSRMDQFKSWAARGPSLEVESCRTSTNIW